MGWVRLDDGFLDHPKFIEAGPLAAYLNICAIAWCNRNRTDGEIPRGQVPRLVNFDGFAHHVWMGEVCGGGDDAEPYELAAELVSVGLWEPTDKGWRIHDYLDWQQSKDDIEAARTQRVEAGRRGGKARSAKRPPSESSSESLSTPLSEMVSDSLSEMPSKTQARSNQEGRRKKEEGKAVNSPAVVVEELASKRTVSQSMAEKVTGILQRGIDGLTSDEGCKRPSAERIAALLDELGVDEMLASGVAIEVRSIAQSQNRAPNIEGLYASKLRQAVATRSSTERGAA